MADAKRITPEEVVEAYRKTGMGVARGVIFSADRSCGCGLGVYAVANLGVVVAARMTLVVESALCKAGFSAAYRDGFAFGFDGKTVCDKADAGDARYMLGHADGIAAYKAVHDYFTKEPGIG